MVETIGRDRVGDERSDTELVMAAKADDPAAYGQLFERWFDRSWNVARTILRDDDLAADVAQDAMVRAWQQLGELRDPDAFGGWLLRSTRNRALNRLAREGRSRASGDDVVSGLRDRGSEDPVGAERQPEPDAVSEIRDRQELLWAAATALGERDLSLLDLHLRHGLSPAEIAEELGVEANAAHQQLFRLRSRLGDAIGSYLLWRNGRPLCEGLAEAVSGRTAFDRSVAKAVARHQSTCEHCADERAALVDPAKLFAAVPLLLVPPHLKAQAAVALDAAGVPTGGSEAAAGDVDHGADQANGGPDGGGADQIGVSDAGPDGGTGGGADTAGSSGNGPAATNGSGAQPDGIRLDFSGAPTDPAGAPPGGPAPVALASQGQPTGGPGPIHLAPSVGLPRGRAVALAGAGVAAVVAVIVLGVLVFRDGAEGGGVAAIGSETTEPEVEAATQDGNGDQAPSGPATFAPSSESGSTSSAEAGTSIGRSTTAGGRAVPSTATTTAPSTGSATAPTVTAGTTGTTVETTGSTPTTGTTRVTQTTPTTGTTRTTGTTDTTQTTTDTTGTTRTTATPVDPPLIIRFDSRGAGGTLLCRDRNQRPFEVSWFAENTDSVTLNLPNSSPTSGPEGTYAFCGSTGDRVSIVATGPGGTDKDSTTL